MALKKTILRLLPPVLFV